MFPTARGTQGHGGGALLLAAWDRYAGLLDEQIAVLETPQGVRPDLAGFQEIAWRRGTLAKEIEALTTRLRTTGAAVVDLAALQERMAACQDRDRALRKRMAELRDEGLRAIRTLDDRRPGRDGYLARSVTGVRSAGRRFDVRS